MVPAIAHIRPGYDAGWFDGWGSSAEVEALNILGKTLVLSETRPLEVEEPPGAMLVVAGAVIGVVVAVEDGKAAVPGDGCI